MFLDEELEQIWNQDIPMEEKVQQVWRACVSRIGENDKTFTKLRQIDNSFRLFAGRHKELKADFFRKNCIRALGEERGEKFRKAIGW